MLGAMVADAAAMPLHWIYDPDAIASLLKAAKREDRPEFFHTPSSPFYKATVGTQSPYGNQTLVLMRALASGPPASREDDFLASYAKATYVEFSDLDAHAWTDASTRAFVKNFAAGLRWPRAALMTIRRTRSRTWCP